jgi:phospholipid/cholesterol/gamma-HCH transport system substrate-binding protein
MRVRFSELNRFRLGLAGCIVAVSVLLAALNAAALVRWVETDTYQAAFTEVGGLRSGDEVRVAGVPVGEVRDVSLGDAEVRVRFTVKRSVPVGAASLLAVKSLDVLGRMYLQVRPAGVAPQNPDQVIPVGRTTSPYDLNSAVSDLATEATALDTRQMAEALNTVADAFHDTPAPLRESITGLDRLSRTIASRDATIRELLTHSQVVSGILDQRKAQLVNLFTTGNTLLGEFNAQRQVIVDLIRNVSELSAQLSGLVDDNKARLGPTLDELHEAVGTLNANATNIQKSIDGLRRYITQLGEALGTGPYVLGTIQNLPPTNLAPLLPRLLERPPR